MSQDLWKALAHLYPTASPLHDYELMDDGDGRVYLGAWRLPDEPPTEAEIAAAIVAYDAQQEKIKAKKDRQKNDVASAVGKRITTLKQAEKDALLELLIERASGLDGDGQVRPIEEWG